MHALLRDEQVLIDVVEARSSLTRHASDAGGAVYTWPAAVLLTA